MSTQIKKHFELLGHRVEDRVTKIQGVVVSVSFDLFGCIQAIVNPGPGNDGAARDSQWYDVSRLKVLSKEPVMERPNFDFGAVAEGKQDPAEKPGFYKH